MPTPKPNPEPKGPYKYKETKLKNGMVAITPMTTAELNAEKAKAPGGTSVWRDPSVGYDPQLPPHPVKKIPKHLERGPHFVIIPPKQPGVVQKPSKRSQA